MVETTETIGCPECGIPFDTRDELERHSRQIHAIKTTEEEPASGAKGSMSATEDRKQSQAEEK